MHILGIRRTILPALVGLLLSPVPSLSFMDDSDSTHRIRIAEPAGGAIVRGGDFLLRWKPVQGAERYLLFFSREPFEIDPGRREPDADVRREVRRNAVTLGAVGLPAPVEGEWHWAVAARRGDRWETSETRSLTIPRATGSEETPIRESGRSTVGPQDREGRVNLSNGVDVGRSAAKGRWMSGARYGIAGFRGPVRDAWRRALETRGAEVVGYLPDNALVLRMNGVDPGVIATSPGVAWTAPYLAAHKRSLALAGTAKGGDLDGAILLFPGEDADAYARSLESAGIAVTARGRDILRVRTSAAEFAALAEDERVRWIEPFAEPRFFNHECQWVVQSDVSDVRSLWEEGLRGEGILLSLCDSGIRTSHQMFRDDSRSIGGWGDYPEHRKIVAYRRSLDSPYVLFGDDPDAWYHGTHTSCTLAGNDSTLGGSVVDGVAPEARIFFVDGGGASNAVFTPADLADLYLPVYEGNSAGAPRIMSNSWGALGGGAYDHLCEQTDRFVWEHKDFLLVFSNGNGSIPNSVASPAAAKNVLSLGGTENGSSADQIYLGTSRGPTDDGRRKPTLCAPARLQSASGETDNAFQTLDGTSMAAPSAAAGAALVLQYFREGWYPSGLSGGSPAVEPTAALLRAALIAAAEGDVSGYEIPSHDVGWGRLRLEDALHFAGDARRLAVVDETAGLLTGETVSYEVTVASSAEPLEAVLVWTDYPSSPAASRNLVNDLDLAGSGGGETYLGNVFSSGLSATGGARDSINVEEVLLIPSPAVGVWTIEVSARNVPFGPQSFALVVTGDLDATAASVALGRHSYGGEDTVTVRVEDGDLAAPPTVAVQSDTEAEPESLVLVGSGGLFLGSIPTSRAEPASGDGILSVSHGDSIRVTYVDASGGSERRASAGVTLSGPLLLPASGSSEAGAEGVVLWETDVPADSRVLYGLGPGEFSDTIECADLVLSHRVELTGLECDTTYYVAVSSADFRGNRTEDDGGSEPYRITTGPRADVLVVVGDFTFEKTDAYRFAFDRFGWSGEIVEGVVPPVGDRNRGLRSHPAIWWQAGWEEYPPFSDAARDSIARYLDGGGRLAVVSHDAAWAFGDPISGFWSGETETWLAERLKVAWNDDPSYWSIVFGEEGDFISGDYTYGISYDPFRGNGGAGDEIEAAAGSATIDSVWKNNYGDQVGLRWSEGAASGDPESAVWGGTANRGVTYCFEWAQLNEWIEDDYLRARVLDRTLRWMIGRDHPDVTLTALTGGETITAAPASITWNETISGGAGVGARRLEWSGDGGASWTCIDDDAGPSPYAWNLAGVPNGTAVRVRVTVFDGGDPPLTGKVSSTSDLIVDLPGNDTRGPRVLAGGAAVSPDPVSRGADVVLSALVSDSTRGASPMAAAEWSLGPAPAGGGTGMSGNWGGISSVAVDTLDGALLSPSADTIWIRGMDGAGMWGEAYPLPVVVRGDLTGIDGAVNAPARFALHGNAPNPFNPSTRIRFDLPRFAHARLAVYGVGGRLVRDLLNEWISAGAHEATWDGRDDAGREAASGVYFIRLDAAGERSVRKTVLLR